MRSPFKLIMVGGTLGNVPAFLFLFFLVFSLHFSIMLAYVWDEEVHQIQIFLTTSGLLPESCKKGPGLRCSLDWGLGFP